MTRFGNEASSHSDLIPLKTAYKKRGELLWAIASKKNFINLHSAAFDINLHQKGPSVKSPGYANYRVKRLMIHYNIRATLCESFCDVITRVR